MYQPHISIWKCDPFSSSLPHQVQMLSCRITDLKCKTYTQNVTSFKNKTYEVTHDGNVIQVRIIWQFHNSMSPSSALL